MNENQSNSLRIPCQPCSFYGYHWRWVRGFFITLMQNDGTLDYYRHLAETNPDIAVLVDMIDRLQGELIIALTTAIRP